MNEHIRKLITHSSECNINGYGYCDCGADPDRYLGEKDVKEIVNRNNEAFEHLRETVKSLRQAIEQAEKQEPVCVAFIRQLVSIHEDGSETWKDEPIYILPPRKEWVRLTELEIAHGLEKANLPAIFSYRAAARAGIDAFKEKNNGN